jgi:hypothetical protein
MISGPTELTHTTNILAYNAPDLYPRSASNSSKGSDDESDQNSTGAESPPTSPDTASLEDRSASPEPNHLSCYFTAPGQKLNFEAPVIPKRAPSHTKKASLENLAHRQQVSRMSSQSNKSASSKASSFALSRSASTSTTATSHSSGSMSYIKSPIPEIPESKPAEPAVKPNASNAKINAQQKSYTRSVEGSNAHPFGQELAQVTEIAEDYGVRNQLNVIDEEEQELIAKGLCLFKPEDYLAEVQGLISSFFTPQAKVAPKLAPASAHPVWI